MGPSSLLGSRRYASAALLFLLSLGAENASAATEKNERLLADHVDVEDGYPFEHDDHSPSEIELEMEARAGHQLEMGGGKASKARTRAKSGHRPHHGGGGKHGEGPDGHHAIRENWNYAKSAKGAANMTHVADPWAASGNDVDHDAGPLTRCLISNGNVSTSMLVADIDPDAAPDSYACVAMCYDCAASHMSSIDFCSNEQSEAGEHLSVHLAVPEVDVEETRIMFADASRGFLSCQTDDCNAADACEMEGRESHGKAAKKKAKGGKAAKKEAKGGKATKDDGWGSDDQFHGNAGNATEGGDHPGSGDLMDLKSGKSRKSSDEWHAVANHTHTDGSTAAGHRFDDGGSKSGKSAKSKGSKAMHNSNMSTNSTDDDWWSDGHTNQTMSMPHDAKSGKAGGRGSADKGSDKKPKAGKSVTGYFIKETTYDHEHHEEGDDHEGWGGAWSSGKSGKSAYHSSNQNGNVTYSGSWSGWSSWSGSGSGKSGKSAHDSLKPSYKPIPAPGTNAPASTASEPSYEPSDKPTPAPASTASEPSLKPSNNPTRAPATPAPTTYAPTVLSDGGTGAMEAPESTEDNLEDESEDQNQRVRPAPQAPPRPFASASENERSPRIGEDPTGYPTQYPTYFPTVDRDSLPELRQGIHSQEQEQDDVPKQEALLEPFGIKLYASVAEPNYDEDIIKDVTMKHLIHSFRIRDWEVDELNLMILEKDRKLMKVPNVAAATSPTTLRWLAKHPVYEIVFGGVLYLDQDAAIPSEHEIDLVVNDSFEDERGEYYAQLLQEEGMEIEKVRLDHKLDESLAAVRKSKHSDHSDEGFNWAGLMIGMSSAIGGIGLLAMGGKRYQNRKDRQLLIDDLNVKMEDGGDYKDYAIRLQYSNEEIEAFPGRSDKEEATVASTTASSEDHLSVPSLVRGTEDHHITFESNDGPGGNVSPLESPQEVAAPRTPSSPTRYVSVFTVKKDCGGKALEDVDLRALAIAYLSRMLKKFPNTHLLPYDKNTPLPAITNIRNIPDDMEELRMYVGNARVDDRTGKVLFNLRVESDEPVSRMKTAGGRGGPGRFKASLGKGSLPAIGGNTIVKSMDEMEQEEMPRSPGEFSDVNL